MKLENEVCSNIDAGVLFKIVKNPKAGEKALYLCDNCKGSDRTCPYYNIPGD